MSFNGMKPEKKVALLMGGTSAEREISLKSGEAVLGALRSKGIDAIVVDTGEPHFIQKLLEQPIDRAFIALHGRGGEDGVIQGVLEVLNVPYTGSRVLASALSMDKLQTKRIWQAVGLPVIPHVILDKAHMQNGATEFLEKTIGYPVMVKPTQEGSSIGITRVLGKEALLLAYQKAAQCQCEVMAERWIEGEEYTVGILGERALPSIRILPDGVFYDFDAKYRSSKTQFFCPSGLCVEEESAIKTLALKAFQAVGCYAWGRVDFIRDKTGEFWLLEINTVPGLTDHSLVPMAAKQAGISFDGLVLEIFMLAK